MLLLLFEINTCCNNVIGTSELNKHARSEKILHNFNLLFI